MMNYGNLGSLIDVLKVLTRNDFSTQEHEIIVAMIAMQVGWKLEEIQYQHHCTIIFMVSIYQFYFE